MLKHMSSHKDFDYMRGVKYLVENDTLGIIICKQDDEYVIKYCSDNFKRI